MIQTDRLHLFLLPVVLALGVALAAPPAAQAQTPAATVKDDGDNVVFQSFVEGQLYAPGSLGSGAIPKEGAGTRLLWWPAKAAVRAGRVGVNNNTEDNWNAANVGDYSAAFGKDTEASGEGALATGAVSTASGANAVAMGARSDASGGGALAVGYAAVASGDQSAAIGEYASADGSEAVAMGWGTTAATNQSLALGECNAANTSADGTLLVVGNGFFGTSDCNSTSDALTLDDQGNLEVSGGFVLPDGTTLEGSGDVSGLPTNSNGAALISNEDGLVAPGSVGSGSIPTGGRGHAADVVSGQGGRPGRTGRRE